MTLATYVGNDVVYYKNIYIYHNITFLSNFLGSIRTLLAYIANSKKSCYIKQQSHSFESARQLTSFTTEKWSKVTSVMALDGVTSFDA